MAIDNRLHNDCDGGQCFACDWDRMQAALQADRRAWFDPNASAPVSLAEYGRMQIDAACKTQRGQIEERSDDALPAAKRLPDTSNLDGREHNEMPERAS